MALCTSISSISSPIVSLSVVTQEPNALSAKFTTPSQFYIPRWNSKYTLSSQSRCNAEKTLLQTGVTFLVQAKFIHVRGHAKFMGYTGLVQFEN